MLGNPTSISYKFHLCFLLKTLVVMQGGSVHRTEELLGYTDNFRFDPYVMDF